jgi:hypothetical protein
VQAAAVIKKVANLKVPKCEIFHLFDFNEFYCVSIGRGLEG